MPKVTTERRARRWLRLDALYCVAAGVLTLALTEPLGKLFHVTPELAAGAGAAAVVWGVLLARFATRLRWRAPLALVAIANAAASAALFVLAILAPGVTAHILLVAIALEVAAFASIQLRILRHTS